MDNKKKEQVLGKLHSMPEDWKYKGKSKNQWIQYFENLDNPVSSAVAVAIRAHESFDRYTILKQGNYETGYYGMQNGVRTYSPVMDMTNEDVYRFFSVFDFPINRAYALMYDAGIPLSKMRIGSIVNSHASNSSRWLNSLDPGAAAKAMGRLDGLNFHNAYGGAVHSSKLISIPQEKPFNEGRPKKVQQEAIELLGLDYYVVE